MLLLGEGTVTFHIGVLTRPRSVIVATVNPVFQTESHQNLTNATQ